MLYEMMRQPQGPSKQEILGPDLMKFESREANKSTSDAKSRVSSPISNSPSAPPQSSSQPLPQNSGSSVTHMSAVGGYLEPYPRAQSSISLFLLPPPMLHLVTEKLAGKKMKFGFGCRIPRALFSLFFFFFFFLVVSQPANGA